MLTLENEYFIRLLLLILKAGTLVLRQVFMKKLEDSGLQLSGFILTNKRRIDKLKEDKVLTLKQYNILFPSHGKMTDLGNYDISLLSCLLLNISSLKLGKPEVKAIENIRSLRNDFQAHPANDNIGVRTFFREWNQLRTSIDNLSYKLTTEQRAYLTEVVRSVGDDPIDIKQAIKDIKEATSATDQFMELVSQQLDNLSHVVKEIRRRQEETRTELKELQQKCEDRNKPPIIIIIGKVTISSKDPKDALAAARILTDDAKKCTRSFKNTSSMTDGDRKSDTHATSSSDLTSTASETNAESDDTEGIMNAIVQDINNTECVIVDITEGSVLLHIQCHSVPEVSRVVHYFQSSKIAHRLNDIAKYLTEKVGSDVHLSANIEEESLQEALDYLRRIF